MAKSPHLPQGHRVYAIGDVHGRLDLLCALLTAIRHDNDARSGAEVRLILLGDLIDRGPASAEVVAQCRAVAALCDRFIVLKGNHEAAMLEALKGSFPALAFWLQHGGAATLESWSIPADLTTGEPSRDLMRAARAQVPAEEIAWLGGLPLSHQCGNCLFVHAGIRPGVPLVKQTATDLLWIRGDFINSATAHPYVVVHGHTVQDNDPHLQDGRIGIDTGAYRTGCLTAIGIEGEDFWFLSTDAQGVPNGDADQSLSLAEDVAAILSLSVASATASPRTKTSALLMAWVVSAALIGIGMAAMMLLRGPEIERPPARLGTKPLSRSPSAETMRQEGTNAAGATSPLTPTIASTTSGVGTTASLDGDPRRSDRADPVPPARAMPASGSHLTGDNRFVSVDRASHTSSGAASPSAANPALPVARAALATSSTIAPTVPSDNAQESERLPTAAEGPIVVARPGSRMPASPEKERERSRALDAIRALRRQ